MISFDFLIFYDLLCCDLIFPGLVSSVLIFSELAFNTLFDSVLTKYPSLLIVCDWIHAYISDFVSNCVILRLSSITFPNFLKIASPRIVKLKFIQTTKFVLQRFIHLLSFSIKCLLTFYVLFYDVLSWKISFHNGVFKSNYHIYMYVRYSKQRYSDITVRNLVL